MENKHLIDLSIKYNLNSTEVSKLIDIIYQAGVCFSGDFSNQNL